MCGIVGYVGGAQAQPVIIEGLKKLEYRGYDSAGIAVVEHGRIHISKSVGKIKQLEEKLQGGELKGSLGLGHTRWATHGRPSDENAHPHRDCTGKIVAVHNGIIENYVELREELIKSGHRFESQTDTEVIPHLLEDYYQGDLEAAMRKVLGRIHGSYAIVAMTESEPDRLVVARKDSPLIIGLGQGENLIASDIPAVLAHTKKTYILDDGEVAVVTRDCVQVTDVAGNPVDKQVYEVKWDPEAAEKGGYEHFMLKEISEQPRAIRDTLTGRILPGNTGVSLEELQVTADYLAGINKIFIVAAGTAYHAGMVGKYLLERLVRIPVEVDIASEFRYRNPILDEKTMVIVVSQSGETADTLAALREAKKRGSKVLAVTNVVGSSVAREADHVIYTWAGPEIAVASTKAYTTQLVALTLLTIHFAKVRGTLAGEQVQDLLLNLRRLPVLAQEILDQADTIKEWAEHIKNRSSAFFIGRSLDYAVALEGSLKLKEISYIHAEAYASGELKHGTLALITDETPVIALVTQPDLMEKSISNIQEVRARDAEVLAIGVEGLGDLSNHSDRAFLLPKLNPELMPVLTVLPLQLLSYYTAVARGTDVDKPRNLAKSVTVE